MSTRFQWQPVSYPGYQRFFSLAAGIFGVGRRPTHLRPEAEATSHLFAPSLTCLHRQTPLVHCLSFAFLQCSFKTFRSRHHNTSRRYTYVMSTTQLEIFFHVLVYSCQSIVAFVRFKVPLVVVRSQSAVDQLI